MAWLSHANKENGITIPPKPRRPFTEYHIFFQLERNYILQTPSQRNNKDDEEEVDTTITFTDIDPNASTRPLKYRDLILPNQWHSKGSRPKCRSHRKNHGKITFVELTKLISKRWREADGITKRFCRDLAERELKRYREDMKEHVELYGVEAGKTKPKTKKMANHKPSSSSQDKKEKKASQEKKGREMKHEEDKLVRENMNMLLQLRRQAAILAASSDALHFSMSMSHRLLYNNNMPTTTMTTRMNHDYHGFNTSYNNFPSSSSSNPYYNYGLPREVLLGPMLQPRMAELPPGGYWPLQRARDDVAASNYRPSSSSRVDVVAAMCWPSPPSQPSPDNAPPAAAPTTTSPSPPFSPRPSSSSPPSVNEEDEEDELGVFLYQFSRTAKARAAGAKREADDDASSSSNNGDISIPQNTNHHTSNNPLPCPDAVVSSISDSDIIGNAFSN